MPSYASLNSFPAVATLTVTTSWTEITVPAGCFQVDVYAVTNDIVFDYAATPTIEAPIDAGAWFTIYAKTGPMTTRDMVLSLKGSTTTTVYLRFL